MMSPHLHLVTCSLSSVAPKVSDDSVTVASNVGASGVLSPASRAEKPSDGATSNLRNAPQNMSLLQRSMCRILHCSLPGALTFNYMALGSQEQCTHRSSCCANSNNAGFGRRTVSTAEGFALVLF